MILSADLSRSKRISLGNRQQSLGDWQLEGIARRFRIGAKWSSVAIESRAAVATFVVMAYIIFANSSIQGTLADSRGKALHSRPF